MKKRECIYLPGREGGFCLSVLLSDGFPLSSSDLHLNFVFSLSSRPSLKKIQNKTILIHLFLNTK